MEIKFRGKRVDNGEWVEGYYYQLGSQHYIRKDIHIWQVHPETLGQFTGLYDKKGKEIYKGDVVKNVNEYQIKYRPDVEELRVIEFDNIAQGCEPFIELAASGWQSADPKDVEVIGNIIENPELLEKIKN